MTVRRAQERNEFLNRLTNMVDGVGTTIYTYTAGSQLSTEDGPWASDTVTNAYSNRLNIFDITAAQVYWQTCLLLGK